MVCVSNYIFLHLNSRLKKKKKTLIHNDQNGKETSRVTAILSFIVTIWSLYLCFKCETVKHIQIAKGNIFVW